MWTELSAYPSVDPALMRATMGAFSFGVIMITIFVTAGQAVGFYYV